MPNEPTTPENEIVVETTKVSKGKVTVFGNINNPTPTILARATKAMRYFATAMVTMVGATDLFTGGQAKIICFILGVTILFLGAVDIIIGVESEKKP